MSNAKRLWYTLATRHTTAHYRPHQLLLRNGYLSSSPSFYSSLHNCYNASRRKNINVLFEIINKDYKQTNLHLGLFHWSICLHAAPMLVFCGACVFACVSEWVCVEVCLSPIPSSSHSWVINVHYLMQVNCFGPYAFEVINLLVYKDQVTHLKSSDELAAPSSKSYVYMWLQGENVMLKVISGKFQVRYGWVHRSILHDTDGDWNPNMNPYFMKFCHIGWYPSTYFSKLFSLWKGRGGELEALGCICLCFSQHFTDIFVIGRLLTSACKWKLWKLWKLFSQFSFACGLCQEVHVCLNLQFKLYVEWQTTKNRPRKEWYPYQR